MSSRSGGAEVRVSRLRGGYGPATTNGPIAKRISAVFRICPMGTLALCRGRIRSAVVEFGCSRHRTAYLALQTSYGNSDDSSVPSASCLHRINSILAECPVESDTISRDVVCDERHLFIAARYAATDGTSVSGVLRRCEIVSHYEFSTQAWFSEMEDVHHVQTSGPLWDKTSFRFACVV